MDKKLVELLLKVKSDLEEMKIKVSKLEVLFNDFVEAKRTCTVLSSQFKIKYFKIGDLN